MKQLFFYNFKSARIGVVFHGFVPRESSFRHRTDRTEQIVSCKKTINPSPPGGPAGVAGRCGGGG